MLLLLGVGAALIVFLGLVARLPWHQRMRFWAAMQSADSMAGFGTANLFALREVTVRVVGRDHAAGELRASLIATCAGLPTVVAPVPSRAAELIERWAAEQAPLFVLTHGVDGDTIILQGDDGDVVALRTLEIDGTEESPSGSDHNAAARRRHPSNPMREPHRRQAELAEAEETMLPIQHQLITYLRGEARKRRDEADRAPNGAAHRDAAAAMHALAQFVGDCASNDELFERLGALQSPLLDTLAPPPHAAKMFLTFDGEPDRDQRDRLTRLADAWLDEELQHDWAELEGD